MVAEVGNMYSHPTAGRIQVVRDGQQDLHRIWPHQVRVRPVPFLNFQGHGDADCAALRRRHHHLKHARLLPRATNGPRTSRLTSAGPRLWHQSLRICLNSPAASVTWRDVPDGLPALHHRAGRR
eukprot:5263590-Pleurochrysis_carterae.AAC.1